MTLYFTDSNGNKQAIAQNLENIDSALAIVLAERNKKFIRATGLQTQSINNTIDIVNISGKSTGYTLEQ